MVLQVQFPSDQERLQVLVVLLDQLPQEFQLIQGIPKVPMDQLDLEVLLDQDFHSLHSALVDHGGLVVQQVLVDQVHLRSPCLPGLLALHSVHWVQADLSHRPVQAALRLLYPLHHLAVLDYLVLLVDQDYLPGPDLLGDQLDLEILTVLDYPVLHRYQVDLLDLKVRGLR